MLRIESMLGRSDKSNKGNGIQLGNYTFDTKERLLIFESKNIHLNNTENLVLDLLCKNLNNFVTRDEIVKHVWGNEDLKLKEGSLNNTLSRLRKYLDKDARVAIVTRSTLGVKLLIES